MRDVCVGDGRCKSSALCTVQAARAVDGRGGGERVHTQVDVEALLEQVERRLLHTHVRLDADQDKVGHLLVLREPRRDRWAEHREGGLLEYLCVRDVQLVDRLAEAFGVLLSDDCRDLELDGSL